MGWVLTSQIGLLMIVATLCISFIIDEIKKGPDA